jgi:hypothetical protein
MKQYHVVITPEIHERIERAFEYIYEQSRPVNLCRRAAEGRFAPVPAL